MAALLLTQHQKSASVSAKKKTVTRTAIFSPYEDNWPICKEEDVEAIIKHMKSTFAELKVGRKRAPLSRTAKKQNCTPNEEKDLSQNPLKSKLVIGINAVTRGLEKGHLAALVVDRSTNPPVLIKHLIQLCAVRNCPVMCLPKLSEEVGPVLNLHSCIAIGFREVTETESQDFYNLISHISSSAEPIQLSFLDETNIEKQNYQTPKRKYKEITNEKISNKKYKHGEIDVSEVIDTALESKSKDYSYLHVMKKDLESEKIIPGEGTKTFNGDDFIGFSAGDKQINLALETDSEEEVWYELGQGHSVLTSRGISKEESFTVKISNQKLKKEKTVNSKKNKQRYMNANVGRIQSNVHKKK